MSHTPAPIVRLGKVEHCEIGGFHAIGQEGSAATAYVATEQDADLYAAAPLMYEALREITAEHGACSCRFCAVIAKAEGRS